METAQEAETLQVPLLRSGGIILGYQCNLGCRHCNYNCGPNAGSWMTEDTLDEVLDALSRERRLLDVHLAGSEPTLNPDLLVMAIRKALEKKLRLSYVETNGHFAHSMDSARKTLLPLKQAGLNAVLVSVSPYHNEAVPLRHTLNCLHAAVEIFGEDSVFPWLGHFVPMLAKMDPEIPHTLDEFFVPRTARSCAFSRCPRAGASLTASGSVSRPSRRTISAAATAWRSSPPPTTSTSTRRASCSPGTAPVSPRAGWAICMPKRTWTTTPSSSPMHWAAPMP